MFKKRVLTAICAGVFLLGCVEKEKEVVHEPVFKPGESLKESESFQEAIKELSARYKSAMESAVDQTGLAVSFDGEGLTLDEIDRRGGQAHLNALLKSHKYRQKEIESFIIEKIYEREGRLHGITGEELLRKVMEAGMATIDRKDYVKGGEVDIQRFETASQEAGMLAHLEFVTKGVEKYSIDVFYKTPKVVAALGDAGIDINPLIFGNRSAEVVVEIFMDFECPYCREVEGSIAKLYKAFGDKARFEYNIFPIPGHEKGRLFGLVGYCAGKQDLFWPYHKAVFANASILEGGIFKAKQIAGGLGADLTEIEECLASGEASDAIESYLSRGVGIGVTGTPTVMIAGVPVSGNQEYSEYERVLKAMLGL